MDGDPSFLGFEHPHECNEIFLEPIQHCSCSSFGDWFFASLSYRCHESFFGLCTSGSGTPAQERSIGFGHPKGYPSVCYGGQRRQNQFGASKSISLDNVAWPLTCWVVLQRMLFETILCSSSARSISTISGTVAQARQSGLQGDCLHDNRGVLSYSTVCWASPTEFVLAGHGAGIQWWDNRRPGGAVAQSPAKW